MADQEKKYNRGGAPPPKSIKALRRQIVKLAWPVVTEMSSMTLTQIADMLMVGRLGAVAVTSVGLSMLPIQYSIRIFNALNVGTTTMVAQFHGAGKDDEARETLQQSLLLSFFIILLAATGFYFYAPHILSFLGAEPAVIETGTMYMRIMVPGFIFMFFRMVVTAAFRGIGDTKTPMKINVMVNAINVVGNYVLIFGHLGFPALGVAGAAIATSFARSLGGFLLLVTIFTRHPTLKLAITQFFRRNVLNLQLVKRILSVGLPASLEQIVRRVGQLFYVQIVASLGTVAYAAHQIALRTESLSYMPGFGIAVAATALVGQSIGARDTDGAERGAIEAWKVAVGVMCTLGVIFFVFNETFMRLFTPEEDIIQMGAVCLQIVAFAQLPMATHFIFSWSLRGAGDTRTPLLATFVGTWVGRLLGAYVLVYWFNLGLAGAWIAQILDWGLRAVIVAARFRSNKWKNIKV